MLQRQSGDRLRKAALSLAPRLGSSTRVLGQLARASAAPSPTGDGMEPPYGSSKIDDSGSARSVSNGVVRLSARSTDSSAVLSYWPSTIR